MSGRVLQRGTRGRTSRESACAGKPRPPGGWRGGVMMPPGPGLPQRGEGHAPPLMHQGTQKPNAAMRSSTPPPQPSTPMHLVHPPPPPRPPPLAGTSCSTPCGARRTSAPPCRTRQPEVGAEGGWGPGRQRRTGVGKWRQAGKTQQTHGAPASCKKPALASPPPLLPSPRTPSPPPHKGGTPTPTPLGPHPPYLRPPCAPHHGQQVRDRVVRGAQPRAVVVLRARHHHQAGAHAAQAPRHGR